MSDKKKNRILTWPTPSGTLPEFEEVCVKLINPAERANTGNIDTLQKAVAYIASKTQPLFPLSKTLRMIRFHR